MDSTILNQGDERGYAAMSKTAQASVTGLPAPLKAAGITEDLLRTMSIEEFLKKLRAFA